MEYIAETMSIQAQCLRLLSLIDRSNEFTVPYHRLTMLVRIVLLFDFPQSFHNLFSLQTHLLYDGGDKTESIGFSVFNFYQKIKHQKDLRSDGE